MSENQPRVRATTFDIKNSDARNGFVMKFRPEAVEQFIDELEVAAKEGGDEGVTMFVSVYENESQYDDGGTYLSTTFGAIATEPYEKGNDKRSNESKRGAARSKAKGAVSNYASKVKSRRS